MVRRTFYNNNTNHILKFTCFLILYYILILMLEESVLLSRYSEGLDGHVSIPVNA
jgi:hypothetical protein